MKVKLYRALTFDVYHNYLCLVEGNDEVILTKVPIETNLLADPAQYSIVMTIKKDLLTYFGLDNPDDLELEFSDTDPDESVFNRPLIRLMTEKEAKDRYEALGAGIKQAKERLSKYEDYLQELEVSLKEGEKKGNLHVLRNLKSGNLI